MKDIYTERRVNEGQYALVKDRQLIFIRNNNSWDKYKNVDDFREECERCGCITCNDCLSEDILGKISRSYILISFITLFGLIGGIFYSTQIDIILNSLINRNCASIQFK